MIQFIGICIVFGIVIAYDKYHVNKSRNYLRSQYEKALLEGDREAARWYSERLNHLK